MSVLSTITIGSNTITVVALPAHPGPRMVEFAMEDMVAVVTSPFSGQTQTQSWPGADHWTATLTMPPLSQAQEGGWKAFLGAMRGMQNGALVGMDPSHLQSRLSSYPAIAGTFVSTDNVAGSQWLKVVSYPASVAGILQPGDYLQLGYRLHMVMDVVDSDASGQGMIPIWPSLREQPVNGLALNTVNPRGLFRLAQNKRGWSAEYTRVSSLSIQLTEYR